MGHTPTTNRTQLPKTDILPSLLQYAISDILKSLQMVTNQPNTLAKSSSLVTTQPPTLPTIPTTQPTAIPDHVSFARLCTTFLIPNHSHHHHPQVHLRPTNSPSPTNPVLTPTTGYKSVSSSSLTTSYPRPTSLCSFIPHGW